MNHRQHHIFIFITVLLPFVAFAVAVGLLWNTAVGLSDVVAFVTMYVVAGFGVSIGYHRLLTHRAFVPPRWLRFGFIAAGAMAGQGPPIIWAAHHRRHHRVADRPGDPHSPWEGQEPGFRGLMKGLWHAHLGWLFNDDLTSDPLRYAPDLARDRDTLWLSRHFVAVVVVGLVIPGVIGFAIGGTATSFLTGVLWGGFVRFFIGNHVTYAVNSIGHVFGRRRFSVADESRNVAWLAIPSFGEAWHNNHHAFPRSYSHGMRWYEVDPSAMLIRGLEAVGLAKKVVRIRREDMDRREQAFRARGGGRGGTAAPAPPLATVMGTSRDFDIADVE